MSDKSNTQSTVDIPITEAMVEAGVEVLLCEFGGSAVNHFWSAPDLAKRVYSAMKKAEGLFPVGTGY